MHIGILEDDVAIQEMLVLVLMDEGYTVTRYKSAKECLEAMLPVSAYVPSPVNLLMIDWRLGNDMPGTEVIRQLRSNSSLATLPIILMTAAMFNEFEALKTYRAVFLEKPFSVDEISSMIKQMTQPQGLQLESL